MRRYQEPTRFRRAAIGILIAFCMFPLCPAQSSEKIVTFDAPPTAYPPAGGMSIDRYSELGMVFRPLQSSGFFQRIWPTEFGNPYNETIFIRAGRVGMSEISFALEGGEQFSLVSVDLAELFRFTGSSLVPFVGYRADGSSVTASFTLDGIVNETPGDFQTFGFGPEFSQLTRVEMPEVGWSMDNLVFTVVPEPSPGVLLVLGGALLLRGQRRTKARRRVR